MSFLVLLADSLSGVTLFHPYSFNPLSFNPDFFTPVSFNPSIF